MSRLPSSEARQKLPEALNRVAFGGERVVIHRRGKDLAALVSIEDLQLIEQLENKIDAAAVKRARKDERPTVPWEKAKRRLGL